MARVVSALVADHQLGRNFGRKKLALDFGTFKNYRYDIFSRFAQSDFPSFSFTVWNFGDGGRIDFMDFCVFPSERRQTCSGLISIAFNVEFSDSHREINSSPKFGNEHLEI